MGVFQIIIYFTIAMMIPICSIGQLSHHNTVPQAWHYSEPQSSNKVIKVESQCEAPQQINGHLLINLQKKDFTKRFPCLCL